MKKKTYLLTLIIIVLFCCSSSKTENSNISAKYIKVADTYFDYIIKSDFTNAAKQFHYPPYYTKDQLEKDIKGVSVMLAYIEKEFGEVQSYKINKEKIQISEIYLYGGDFSYWQQHHWIYRINYRVQFKKEGEGFIRITFCDIIEKIQIQQVGYGLILSKPHANERFKEISDGYMKVLNKL